MLPGETATIAVFLEDTTPGPDLLNAYLIVLHYDAAALPCSAGDVTYVDENPGQPGGASIFLDTQRPDWVFAGSSLLPVIYNETPGGGYFGVFYATIPNTFVDLSGLGIRYLVQFGITASGGACGQFEFPFRLSPEPPPLSSLRNPIGAFLPVNEWQTLIISLPACCDDGNPCTTEICDPVGGCANILQCTSDSECTDADGCTIDLCATDGCCVYEPLDCDDSDPCTSDGCLPLSGCIN
jgi:hypothetical protein